MFINAKLSFPSFSEQLFDVLQRLSFCLRQHKYRKYDTDESNERIKEKHNKIAEDQKYGGKSFYAYETEDKANADCQCDT